MKQYKSETQKLMEIYGDEIRKYKSIIDIGCGHDKILPEAFGVDSRNFPWVDRIVHPSTIYNLHNTIDQKFDLVYSSHCLEHLLFPKAALESWSQLLSTDGKIILYLPDEDYYKEENPAHLQHYTMSKFLQWVNSVCADFLTVEDAFHDTREQCYSFVASLSVVGNTKPL